MNAIYARQSIDKKDSLSIEGQIERCRKFAGDGAKIFEDRGYSGKNTKRPAFTELMNAVKSGEIKKIFVYRLDRFSRSIADFSRLWELLDKCGVEFYSATENFDTSSPMGRAMLNIVLVFAQLERETTAERVKDNYIHRFNLGAWGGGPAPYGFDLIKIDDGARKVSSLVKNSNAETVKYIFETYANTDISLRNLALNLTSDGIHAPKREAWDGVSLSRILHSPIYVKANADIYWYYVSKGMKINQSAEAFDGVHACSVMRRRDRGKNKYNEFEKQALTVANHEGIIEAEIWLKAQEKLNNNKQISRANAGKYSFLTGLMKCAKCGYAIKVNNFKKDGKLKLVCSGKSNLSACDADIAVDLRELESYISDEIEKALETPPNVNLPDTNENSEELLSIERKIERLVCALAEGSEISAVYITKEIERLHKMREEMLNKPKNEVQKFEKIDFKSLGFGEKKLVASQFINRILIGENEVNIEWKM